MLLREPGAEPSVSPATWRSYADRRLWRARGTPLYVRSDVNIMVHTYEFDCWWMDVSDWDYGITGYTQLRQWNTPWTRTEYLSTFNTTGDALFSSSVSKQGVPSGCQFYSVSNDAYNSFVVPHGTNYNNQDEAHSGTSYP